MHKVGFIKPAAVEHFVSACPADLLSICYKSLIDTHKGWRQAVVKTLYILLAVRRPLRTAELAFAFAVDKRFHTLSDLRGEMKDYHETIPFLERYLGMLIKVHKSTIALRHHSVRSFLLLSQDWCGQGTESRSDGSNWFSMSMSEAESTLAASSIHFLSLNDFDTDASTQHNDLELWEGSGLGAISISPRETPKVAFKETPELAIPGFDERDSPQIETSVRFLDYAAAYWGSHYASAVSDNGDLAKAALELSARPRVLENWSHRFRRTYQGYDNLPQTLNGLLRPLTLVK